MLTLLNHPVSTCSQKVRLALHEKNLAFEDRWVDLKRQQHLEPAYLALNPHGVVPTLLHEGRPVIDSSVIVEYLDEVFPAKPLMPADARGRAAVRAWMRYFEEVPTAAVRFPSFNQAFVPANFAHQSEEQFAAAARQRPLRRHFYETMGRQGFDDRHIRASLEALRATFARMQQALADGRPWLAGDRLTLADICVYPQTDRCEDIGLGWLWQEAPAVQGWLQRWRDRPSVGAAFYAGARLSESYPGVRERAPTAAWLAAATPPTRE